MTVIHLESRDFIKDIVLSYLVRQERIMSCCTWGSENPYVNGHEVINFRSE